jgi:hypothetical protein
MRKDQKLRHGSFIHLAGYESDATGFHPEFHFIRNVYKINQQGGYEDVREVFQVSEEYWQKLSNRWFPPVEQIYVNSSLPGREQFWAIQWYHRNRMILELEPNQRFQDLTSTWWGGASARNMQNELRVRFATPTSLEEWESVVRRMITSTISHFDESGCNPSHIGGDTQVCSIRPPTN